MKTVPVATFQSFLGTFAPSLSRSELTRSVTSHRCYGVGDRLVYRAVYPTGVLKPCGIALGCRSKSGAVRVASRFCHDSYEESEWNHEWNRGRIATKTRTLTPTNMSASGLSTPVSPRKKDMHDRMVALMETLVKVTVEQDAVVRSLRGELDEMKQRLQLAGGRRAEDLKAAKNAKDLEPEIGEVLRLRYELQKFKASKEEADREVSRLREKVGNLGKEVSRLRRR
ncbi:hypothetical protein SCHPADRAFT_989479 [Schizopora paradoxa]|uniref:Uncharacterized protein n=1 Tax=Schizopora paradoxa TaxID=27342 RepID=A0A0H2RID4_9AGAM|nr:hypothetical protein SCHPADRAFT_989479 [Schizopora paradoxa]